MKESDCWIIEQYCGVWNYTTTTMVQRNAQYEIYGHKQKFGVRKEKKSGTCVKHSFLWIPVSMNDDFQRSA